MSGGLRFNEGKERYDLLPVSALKQIAAVFRIGAKKYTLYEKDGKKINGFEYAALEDKTGWKFLSSGENNWRLGMNWSSVMASVKRHIASWEFGEDFDPEIGTNHLGNAAFGLMALLDFYESYPQGDDRRHWFKKPLKRVWLDMDGVVCSFEQHFLEYLDLPRDPANDWDDPRFRNNYKRIAGDENFWLSMPPLVDPRAFSYPISGYCTSRSCNKEVTSSWLSKNGFPAAPLISLEFGQSKVEALKNECDIFIDDSIKNFIELQSNGILCYLKTRPHNEKYNVGHFRVDSLEQFFEKVRNLK